MRKPKAPATLEAAGKALWVEVVEKYTLRADELAVLEGACRARDMIATLTDVWDGDPWTKGSMGQLVEHPAPKAMRAWQAAHDAALARLKLPDDATAGETSTNPARAAAATRWKHGS